MKNIFLTIAAATALCATSQAQILVSGGTYTQNFDSLVSGETVTVSWTDNSTLPGWYTGRSQTTSGGTVGSYPYATYRYSGGEQNNGWIFSFGTNGVNDISDRALGSISSGTPKTNVFGLRIRNDTQTEVALSVSYTGEQWRMASTSPNTLSFGYRISSDAITDPAPNNTADWTEVTALSFTSPNYTTSTGTPLDGNATANRQLFSSVLLPQTVAGGQEIFLRWLDFDDSGSDQGLGVDDFTVSFAVVPEPSSIALLGLGGLALLFRRRH